MTKGKDVKRATKTRNVKTSKVKISAQELELLYQLDTLDHKLINYIVNYPAMKQTEMMALLGIGKTALRNRLTKPAFKKALSDINQSAVDLLNKAQGKALRRLMKLIDDADPEIAIKACRLVMQPLINHATIDISDKKEVVYKVRFGEQGQLFSEVVEAEPEKQPTTLDLLQ